MTHPFARRPAAGLMRRRIRPGRHTVTAPQLQCTAGAGTPPALIFLYSCILHWFRNHYEPWDPEQAHMGEIIDIPRLREQRFVFSDRHDAGRQLGAFLKTFPAIHDPLVLAIPAGGVPVGKRSPGRSVRPCRLRSCGRSGSRHDRIGIRCRHLGRAGADQ